MPAINIESITQDCLAEVDDWVEDHAGDDEFHEGIDAIIASHIPCMTTMLFQLVVNDNTLAFEDIEREADTPFAALQEAVERRLLNAVGEHLRSREDDEEDASTRN